MYINYRRYQLTLIALLTVILYNSAGYFFVFEFVQRSIEQDIASMIKEDDYHKRLTVILFKKQELSKINWIKKGKEFSLNGKRYDVVSYTETEGTHAFSCIADEDEDRLFASLDHCNNESSSVLTHKPAKKSVFPFYPSYFNRSTFSSYLSADSIIPCTIVLTHYKLVYREINHPPPCLA